MYSVPILQSLPELDLTLEGRCAAASRCQQRGRKPSAVVPPLDARTRRGSTWPDARFGDESDAWRAATLLDLRHRFRQRFSRLAGACLATRGSVTLLARSATPNVMPLEDPRSCRRGHRELTKRTLTAAFALLSNHGHPPLGTGALVSRPASPSAFLRSAYLGEPSLEEAVLGSVVGAFEGGLVCGCGVCEALEAP